MKWSKRCNIIGYSVKWITEVYDSYQPELIANGCFRSGNGALEVVNYAAHFHKGAPNPLV